MSEPVSFVLSMTVDSISNQRELSQICFIFTASEKMLVNLHKSTTLG